MSTIIQHNDALLFGEKLRKARRDLNLNQEKIANLFEITRNYVSQLERGERSPSPHLKRAIEAWIAATEHNPPAASTIYSVDGPAVGSAGQEEQLSTAEETPVKFSDREFKSLCAASFDPVFEFIAEAYGKDSIGIANFLDDLREVHHNYRVWRYEKKHEREGGEIVDDKENLTVPKR